MYRHDAMLSVPHLAQSYATHRYRLAAQAELSICEKCSTKVSLRIREINILCIFIIIIL